VQDATTRTKLTSFTGDCQYHGDPLSHHGLPGQSGNPQGTAAVKEFLIQRYRQDPLGPVIHPTLIRIDDNGHLLRGDRHTEAMFGYEATELAGQPVQVILASRQDDPFAPDHRHRLNNGQTVLVTFRHKEGFFFTARLGLHNETRDSDQAASALILLRDSTDMNSDLLKLAEENASFGLWELNVSTNEFIWSEGIYHLLDLRPGIDLTPEQALFYCQNGQNRVRALFRRCIRSGTPFRINLTLLTDRHTLQTVTLTGQALNESEGPRKLGGVVTNTSDAMRSRAEKQKLQSLFDAVGCATNDLIVAVSPQLELLQFNDAWARQFQKAFGCRPHPGAPLKALLKDFPNERRLYERMWNRAFERGGFIAEMPLDQAGNDVPVYEFHFQRVRGANHELIGAVQVGRDITDRLRRNLDDDRRMRFDPVTGLINRRAFIEHLERALANPHRRQFADHLLLLNLDNFGHYHESAGGGVCDRYLRELATILGLRVRQRDALARLTGDTFALYIENCPEPRARKLADEIRELVARFRFEWQGQQLQVTASGGLLILGCDRPQQAEQLLSQAADLCHTAKTSGRNRIHAGAALPPDQIPGTTDGYLEQLEAALDNNRLTLEYQFIKPVASVTWGDHIEILCRIPGTSEDQPPLTPAQFLPVAERFDLVKRLDRQVIRQTVEWLSQHPLLEPRLKYCSFNLSLASILDDGFPEFMEQTLDGLAYGAGCFCLEIQEAHATRYPDEVAVLCDALHRLGLRVALDGAGASVESYSLAANLPVDVIKLDKRVMQDLEKDPVQQIMAEALHRIAETSGKETVATFIENDETLRRVRTLGIHFGQGYRLARPQPLEELKPAVVELSTGRIGG